MTKKRSFKTGAAVIAVAMIASLSACKEEGGQTTDAPTRVTDGWNGRWTGVEGTYLDISTTASPPQVTIKDLDGVSSYDAIVQEDSITFVRNMKPEVLRAGTGEQTGMKWLADKKDCLYITLGEGYCRD